MNQVQKNEILASAKTNRVHKIPIVESPYAPEEQNVIWLKDGVMYYFNNNEWESLYSTGSGSDEAFETPIELPLELLLYEKSTSSSNSREYILFFKNGSYDTIEDFPVYVIGHYSNGYAPLALINGDYLLREIKTSEYIEDGESAEYGSGSRVMMQYNEDDYIIRLSVEKEQYKDEFVGELLDYDRVKCICEVYEENFSDWPLSIVIDTEYNTTKYPEREIEPVA